MGNFFARIRERSFAVALTVAAVLTFGTLAAGPATAAAPETHTASISGTVVGEGSPLAGIGTATTVTAQSASGSGAVGFARASESGEFTVNDLPAGEYRLTVGNSTTGSPWGSLPANRQNGPMDATLPPVDGGPSFEELPTVVLEAQEHATGVTLMLPLLPMMSGSVSGDSATDSVGDDVLLGGVQVTVTSDTDPNFRRWTETNDAGEYSLRGLRVEAYVVSFNSYDTSSGLAYAPQFWDNKPTRLEANLLTLSAGDVKDTIDATLRAMDPVTVGTPSIAGIAQVGQVLTASPGTWGPGEVDLSYAWQRDGQYFYSGSNDQTYSVTEADLGHRLSVNVFGNKSGFQSKEASSQQTEKVTAASTGVTAAEPTPAPSVPLAETASSTPVSVVGPKSERVTTPAATFAMGARIPITGEGFKPFEVVDIWMHSTPVLLGTLTADAQGRISGSFAMPTGLASGTHHVVLVDEAGVSYTSAELVVTTTDSLAATGADVSSGWLALALIVVGGLALTVSARRRIASARK